MKKPGVEIGELLKDLGIKEEHLYQKIVGCFDVDTHKIYFFHDRKLIQLLKQLLSFKNQPIRRAALMRQVDVQVGYDKVTKGYFAKIRGKRNKLLQDVLNRKHELRFRDVTHGPIAQLICAYNFVTMNEIVCEHNVLHVKKLRDLPPLELNHYGSLAKFGGVIKKSIDKTSRKRALSIAQVAEKTRIKRRRKHFNQTLKRKNNEVVPSDVVSENAKRQRNSISDPFAAYKRGASTLLKSFGTPGELEYGVSMLTEIPEIRWDERYNEGFVRPLKKALNLPPLVKIREVSLNEQGEVDKDSIVLDSVVLPSGRKFPTFIHDDDLDDAMENNMTTFPEKEDIVLMVRPGSKQREMINPNTVENGDYFYKAGARQFNVHTENFWSRTELGEENLPLENLKNLAQGRH